MEIQEREGFNKRIVYWCLERSLRNPKFTHQEVDERVNRCLNHVLAAEQVFRADLLQGRPGMPEVITVEQE